MRICIVTGIFPPDIGGPASYVAVLSEGLHRLSSEVEVVTYSSGVSRRVHPFPVHRISRSIPLPIRLAATLVEIVKRGADSDLIYCNGLILPSALAALLLRKPLIIKIEGDLAWERASNVGLTSDSIEAFQAHRQHWKIELLRAVRNWCVKRAQHLITTSRFLAGLIREWGYRGHVTVISNAVEDELGKDVADLKKEECRARIGFSDRRVVLSAGRLVSWKGFREVVLAARSLPSETVVLIVGDGPERLHLERLIDSMGLSKKVRLMGKVSRAELALYLRAADCFVLNSGYESCPHILLEAIKMGTSVVAARTTGIPEMIQHRENGFLFEKDDLDQMRSCIRECLHGGAGERLAAEAARKLSRYAWKEVFARTLEVLRGTSRKAR